MSTPDATRSERADSFPVQRASFTTTHWGVVLEAGQADSPDARDALELLCQRYWYPLYAFLRRLGHAPAEAEDLTQGFFAYLLERRLITRADPKAGRFRTYLLSTLLGWLSNQHQRETAQKRGGGARPVSFEALSAEERYAAEPVSDETASARYDRTWAESIVGETWRRLASEHSADPKRFTALRPLVLQAADTAACQAVAQELGMTEGAVKVAVHRLRQRFAEVLRATVGETASDPGAIGSKIQYLIRVLST